MYEENIEHVESTSGQLNIEIDLYEAEEPSDLYKQQLALEEEMRAVAIAKFHEAQDRLKQSSAGSDAKVFNKLRKKEVAKIVSDMKSNHRFLRASVEDSTINGTSPKLLDVIDRMVNCIGYESMAVLGFNEVVNSLSFSTSKSSPFEDTIIADIADIIDHQAFMTYLEQIDSRLCQIVCRYSLEDTQKRRKKRIQGSVQLANEKYAELDWDWLSPSDKKLLGNWVKDRVFYGTHLFESMPSFSSSETTTRYVVMLTEKGEELIQDIEEDICKTVGNSYPMVHPPKDWSRTITGGYLTVQPGNRSHLIHNHAGTLVSDMAIEALNRLQQVPWRINTFILDVQQRLASSTHEIGSFRTFDKKTYELLNPLIENPETVELSWEDAKQDPDLLRKKKKAYAIRKQAESAEKSVAQKTIATKRTLEMAERFKDIDRFYMPWYFDNRLRQYCLVDTLNPQGSDNVKAMIQFAEGVPKSEASYRDILISLATTFGNGLDKLSFDERIEGAKRMIPVFEKIVQDPLKKTVKDFWVNADEPFQFLALVHEYYHVFIKCDQDMHYVSSGRDATCSGLQIAGALLRDKKTMHLVNVTPSDTVQDAYKAVAEEAVKLMKNKRWLDDKIKKREESREFKAMKIKAERAERKAKNLADLGEYNYEPRFIIEIPFDKVDRSVAKMIVMLTPYGGSYQTMFKHVDEKMRKKDVVLHKADVTILTHALIEGMALALPGFYALNQWFKSLAKATLESGEKQIKWVTPTDSLVKQEYFEDEEYSIKTYTYGETKVDRYLMTKEPSSKQLKERKMQTALAANTVHSLDATLLQLALHDYDGRCFTTVHDCVYGPSGILDDLVGRIKTAFYDVVKGNFLYNMLEENGLQDHDGLVSQLYAMTHSDDGLLETIKDSQYIFS